MNIEKSALEFLRNEKCYGESWSELGSGFGRVVFVARAAGAVKEVDARMWNYARRGARGLAEVPSHMGNRPIALLPKSLPPRCEFPMALQPAT